MSHDVIISYSTIDKTTADAVCAKLEERGIRCWIAPRDILAGMDYAEAIVSAIDSARIMVLIFSSHANASKHVMREAERAVHDGIPIIPVRIEDVQPTLSLQYYISAQHWLDALTSPLELHILKLAESISILLGKPIPPPTQETPPQPPGPLPNEPLARPYESPPSPPPHVLFCKKCGAPHSPEATFCRGCGRAFVNATSGPTPREPPSSPPPISPPRSAPPKPKGVKIGPKELAYSSKAKYLGGHFAYPNKMDVNLTLSPDYLEIPEFQAMVPYTKITNVQSMSQDKLTRTRLLLIGLLAFAWKEKQMFMVLTYEDDLGLIQNPVFHIEKDKIKEVQSSIYQHMMNARMMQQRVQQQPSGK